MKAIVYDLASGDMANWQERSSGTPFVCAEDEGCVSEEELGVVVDVSRRVRIDPSHTPPKVFYIEEDGTPEEALPGMPSLDEGPDTDNRLESESP